MTDLTDLDVLKAIAAEVGIRYHHHCCFDALVGSYKYNWLRTIKVMIWFAHGCFYVDATKPNDGLTNTQIFDMHSGTLVDDIRKWLDTKSKRLGCIVLGWSPYY